MNFRGIHFVFFLAGLTLFGISIILRAEDSKYYFQQTVDNISTSFAKIFSQDVPTYPAMQALPPMSHYSSNSTYRQEISARNKSQSSIKIHCWVMTQPKNHQTRVRAIRATWGKRCDKLIFISSEPDDSLGIINANVTEGRYMLWGKMKSAYKYIAKHDLNDAEWFLKTDDDAYVIMENLRHLIRPYNASRPLWFGHRFKKFTDQGYMSGGPGFVLSKEALRRLVEEGFEDPMKCSTSDVGVDDVVIGKCLNSVGVEAMDSRDERNRGRFFPMDIANHLIPGFIPPKHWFWNYTFYKDKVGMECCSDTAISFHYISAFKMIELEYLIYRLRVLDS